MKEINTNTLIFEIYNPGDDSAGIPMSSEIIEIKRQVPLDTDFVEFFMMKMQEYFSDDQVTLINE